MVRSKYEMMRLKSKQGKNSAAWQASERKLWNGMKEVLRGRSLRIQVANICKAANVKPPTFYRHFANVDAALMDVEGRMLEELIVGLDETRRRMAKDLVGLTYLDQAEMQAKQAIRRWLIFIAKNHDYFRMMATRGNVRLLRVGLEKIRGDVTRSWASYGRRKDDERYEMFCGEMVSVIVIWGRYGFDMEEMDLVMNRILKVWRVSSSGVGV